MATSSIPWNKVMRYRTEGLSLPPDAALDAEGNYTSDPNRAVCLGPLGGAGFGYKGAALAGMAEVLGGMLTGMRLSIEQSGIVLADTKVGHFVMAIDPSTFVPGNTFAERHAAYLDGFKREPGIMPAGGPEWARRADRQALGIPLPQGLYDELSAAGGKAQVPLAI
jgi:LDH2 family malate/lactate/ureidoglycolate dehydrogenase